MTTVHTKPIVLFATNLQALSGGHTLQGEWERLLSRDLAAKALREQRKFARGRKNVLVTFRTLRTRYYRLYVQEVGNFRTQILVRMECHTQTKS